MAATRVTRPRGPEMDNVRTRPGRTRIDLPLVTSVLYFSSYGALFWQLKA